jgi:hypothetical protein
LILAFAAFCTGTFDVPSLVSLVAAGGAGHGCDRRCSEEESTTEDCSSQCPACPCAPHGSPIVLPTEPLHLLDLAAAFPPERDVEGPFSQAHPRSVFHPPKSR